mmetsp:Transcript_83197/g.211826  ORF Transcript_83197/g.211826 Transcript_83197/m.211826 type:complete len:245 (+) Transcript_83197:1115-1849(+)
MYRQEIHGRVPAVSAAMLPVVNLGRVSSEAAQGVCASHLPCHLGLARCWCQCRCRHSPRWHVERRRHRRERLQGLFHGGGAAQHRRRRGGTDGRTGWRWAFQRLFACFGKRARSRVLRGRPRHGHATGCVPIRHVGRPAAAAAAGVGVVPAGCRWKIGCGLRICETDLPTALAAPRSAKTVDLGGMQAQGPRCSSDARKSLPFAEILALARHPMSGLHRSGVSSPAGRRRAAGCSQADACIKPK